MIMSLLDGAEVGVPIGDVERDRQQRVAVVGYQIVQRRRVARGGRDLVAALEGRDGPFPAETTGRASDEPNLVSHIASFLSCLLRATNTEVCRRFPKAKVHR